MTTERLTLLRATEAFCLENGVDALSLSAIARATDSSVATISALFHNEMALLDAVLERHQTPYEREWEAVLAGIDTPRAALHLLVSTIAGLVKDDDGGLAYISICAQMSTSARFALSGRPATTSPTALKLIGKLTSSTLLPFSLIPTRFDRFGVLLFSSVFAWNRHGAARLPEPIFVDDLVDTLAFMALAPPSAETKLSLERFE